MGYFKRTREVGRLNARVRTGLLEGVRRHLPDDAVKWEFQRGSPSVLVSATFVAEPRWNAVLRVSAGQWNIERSPGLFLEHERFEIDRWLAIESFVRWAESVRVELVSRRQLWTQSHPCARGSAHSDLETVGTGQVTRRHPAIDAQVIRMPEVPASPPRQPTAVLVSNQTLRRRA